VNAEEMRPLKLLALRTYRGTVVVAHPCQISSQLLEPLGRRERRAVRTSIEGFSPYFPSRPFSVVLWRPQDEKIAHEYLELAREGEQERERRERVGTNGERADPNYEVLNRY